MAGRTKKKAPEASGKSSGIRKGRFKKAMDPLFARFNASIFFDKRLGLDDMRGSIAHVEMLAKQRIISADDAQAIKKGLAEIRSDLETDRLEFREDLEDIHINIEEELKGRVGDIAGRLHTARSRNDQVALDLRIYLLHQTLSVTSKLESMMNSLVDKSEECIDLIMPGYTHLQRAQPVRLSHHLMAYFQMFRRDRERFLESRGRIDEMPLGSAALAGTTFPIDRNAVAESLGFSKVSMNSMDAVSDRDFVAEFLFNSCLVMMHLSRLAEDLIVWSSSEFGFCTLPDEYCSGSSIMPQKKNPDACELIRGKTGRVYGNLVAVMTMLKGLPLTYNKDLQEDKEPLFDSLDTITGSLGIMARMVLGIEFHAERMREAASDPWLAATDLADRLTRQGVTFRDAHARIGAMIQGQSKGKRKKSAGENLPTVEEMVEARDHVGGTSRRSVLEQISAARAFLTTGRMPKPARTGARSKKRKD